MSCSLLSCFYRLIYHLHVRLQFLFFTGCWYRLLFFTYLLLNKTTLTRQCAICFLYSLNLTPMKVHSQLWIYFGVSTTTDRKYYNIKVTITLSLCPSWYSYFTVWPSAWSIVPSLLGPVPHGAEELIVLMTDWQVNIFNWFATLHLPTEGTYTWFVFLIIMIWFLYREKLNEAL